VIPSLISIGNLVWWCDFDLIMLKLKIVSRRSAPQIAREKMKNSSCDEDRRRSVELELGRGG
jgi:hypothetical protein